MTETEKVLMEEVKSAQIIQTLTMIYLSENELIEDWTKWMQEKSGRLNVQIAKP